MQLNNTKCQLPNFAVYKNYWNLIFSPIALLGVLGLTFMTLHFHKGNTFFKQCKPTILNVLLLNF
jgi:hypothetical protein